MKILPRIEYLLLGLGFCLVFFVYGIAVAAYQLFPYYYVERLFYMARSVDTNIIQPHIADVHKNRYQRNRFPFVGVGSHEPAKTQPGVTLFSPSNQSTALLISADGEELHRWSIPFSEVWEDPPHVELPVPDRFVLIRDTYLYPNGDLLAMLEAPDFWPYTYGLVKLDKDSKVIWKVAEWIHHDMEVGPDGNIYTLAHEVRSDVIGHDGKPIRPGVTVEDLVVVLSPDGKELKRVSILDALIRSPYGNVIDQLGLQMLAGAFDPTHANSVDVVTRDIADRYDFFQEGQVLISMRSISLIAVLDIPSETITWAMQGSWRRQHSARFLDNGMIGFFDNAGHIGEGGKSRVVEVDPRTGGVTWEFAGSKDRIFSSAARGEVQWLPNGNVLISDSEAGHLMEVNPDREVVWEYISEDQVDGRVPMLFSAQRLDFNTLTFLSNKTQISSGEATDSDEN